MVTLYNVIDTRTGKFHSEVIVKQRMVKFFVPAEEEDALAKGNDAIGNFTYITDGTML